MLHDNMKKCCLMVNTQQVEEAMFKNKSRDANRASSFDSGSSMGRLDIQDKPKIKKRFSNQFPSNFPKARSYRVSTPKS